MSFLVPKTPTITPPPTPAPTPTRADASVQTAGENQPAYSSMISTGAGGLKRKASTAKASLIGGA